MIIFISIMILILGFEKNFIILLFYHYFFFFFLLSSCFFYFRMIDFLYFFCFQLGNLFSLFIFLNSLFHFRIHFPTEGRGKSSALHAKVVAPEHTKVFEFPEFPDYRNDAQKDETVLLFPSKVFFFLKRTKPTQTIKQKQTNRIIDCKIYS